MQMRKGETMSIKQMAKEIVQQFRYRSDGELSLADIQWLGSEITKALKAVRAEALAEAERVVNEGEFCSEFGDPAEAIAKLRGA